MLKNAINVKVEGGGASPASSFYRKTISEN